MVNLRILWKTGRNRLQPSKRYLQSANRVAATVWTCFIRIGSIVSAWNVMLIAYGSAVPSPRTAVATAVQWAVTTTVWSLG